jgi:hypothetical protein
MILTRRNSKKRRSPKIQKQEIHKRETRRPKSPQRKNRTSRNPRAAPSNVPRPPHVSSPRAPAHRVISVRPVTTALSAPVHPAATVRNVSQAPATIVPSAPDLHVLAPHATTVPRVPVPRAPDLPVHARRVRAAHPASAAPAMTVRNVPVHQDRDHHAPAPRVADHPEVDHPVAAPAQDRPAADRVKADSKYRSPVAPQTATPTVRTGQAFHRAPAPPIPSTPPR